MAGELRIQRGAQASEARTRVMRGAVEATGLERLAEQAREGRGGAPPTDGYQVFEEGRRALSAVRHLKGQYPVTFDDWFAGDRLVTVLGPVLVLDRAQELARLAAEHTPAEEVLETLDRAAGIQAERWGFPLRTLLPTGERGERIPDGNIGRLMRQLTRKYQGLGGELLREGVPVPWSQKIADAALGDLGIEATTAERSGLEGIFEERADRVAQQLQAIREGFWAGHVTGADVLLGLATMEARPFEFMKAADDKLSEPWEMPTAPGAA